MNESSPSSIHALGRLQLACAQQSATSLKAAHMELSCTGRLRSASEAGVVLEVLNPPAVNLQGTMASVEFSIGHGVINFVSEVVDVAVHEDPQVEDRIIHVTLALPSDLRSENRRATVRVPVPSGSVEATIAQGSAAGPVQAIDMSLMGMLIEVEPARADALHPGDTISLQLSVGTLRLSVEAEVRRQDGRRFGLLFKTGGRPPKKMGKVMWRIQEARLLDR